MFNWFFKLFEKKWVEVKPSEYKTKQRINGVDSPVPEPGWVLSAKKNDKGEIIALVYVKPYKLDTSGLPKDKR